MPSVFRRPHIYLGKRQKNLQDKFKDIVVPRHQNSQTKIRPKPKKKTLKIDQFNTKNKKIKAKKNVFYFIRSASCSIRDIMTDRPI